MVKSNSWLLFDRFWKHCGGRKADFREAANNAARAHERAEYRVTTARDNTREGLAALSQVRTGLESLEGQFDDLVAARAQAVVEMENERTRAATAETVANEL